ncbi:hypothetical protein [Nitratidesulfovibrio vulgaris]|uniref:Uncharacterized protein n=1 Tax=Nitratidesulfovibrio vulgaris (strain DP4) TaxID=391774 RepID=A0A0H3A6W4_NITV4|nr:hypothetical protein [Nitratidesulfovibrio vulgaris]ABM28064.1 conserved hypothetical protein [Nitratidesulfovibrio vulgaris DP4]
MRNIRLIPSSAIIAEEAGTLLHDVERLFNRSGLNPADKFALANVRMALRRVRDRHRQCLGVDMPDAAPESPCISCHRALREDQTP